MNVRKSFIETLEEVLNKLVEEGIITEEQLKNKIQIPFEWLYSKGIKRDDLSVAMDRICRRINPAYREKDKTSKSIETLNVLKRDGNTILEVCGRDNWTFFRISDDMTHKNGKISYFTTEEFLGELYITKIINMRRQINKKVKLPEDELNSIMNLIYSETQRENELNGLSVSLNDMMLNLGEYYKYMAEEKQEHDEAKKIINGGLIEQEKDQIGPRGIRESSGEIRSRKSDVYSIEEREEIFRKLGPEKIIQFDSIDEDRHVIQSSYLTYLFRNPRQNGGYFLISEPLSGDRETRAVYLTDEYVETMQDGEDEAKFWTEIARCYLEMSRNQFAKEQGTHVFRHEGLEAYEQRMRGVIANDNNVDNKAKWSARYALSHLFGTSMNEERLRQMAETATLEDVNEARTVIMNMRGEQTTDLQQDDVAQNQ